MAKERESIFTDNIYICQEWPQITSEFDSFIRPIASEENLQGWIFRGHKRTGYLLEPSIERAHPCTDWDWAEDRVLQEFQSKAALHMDPRQLPPKTPEHKLDWLAIMQHYGAPTRLLDFTYSPYVALYFALRNREENELDYAEVWGINADALMERAYQVSREADEEEKAREPKKQTQTEMGPVNFGRSEFYESSLQAAQRDEEHLENLVRKRIKSLPRQYSEGPLQSHRVCRCSTTVDPQSAARQPTRSISLQWGRIQIVRKIATTHDEGSQRVLV